MPFSAEIGGIRMSEEYDDLLKRVTHLEKEVVLLKKQQAKWLEKENKSPATFDNEQWEVKELTKEKEVVAKQDAPIKVEKPIYKKKEFDLEQVLSKWLPKVFMFILLLGVLWGLKVAADYGFLTKAIRIVAGYAGTALLYYFGMKFYRQQQKVFGNTLLGGFIALGILTTFAAHYLYGYFNFFFALLVGLMFIALGLWISKRTKSEILTLFSAIAGFLLPFLLEGQNVTVYGFSIYLLLLFMSLFYVALTEQHKYTFYFTFFLFHFTFLIYLLLVGTFDDRIAIVGTVFVQHLTLLFIYFTQRISRHAFTEALIYTNFVFTLGWIKVLEDSAETWVYGGLALFYIGLTIYVFLKKKDLLRGVFSAVSVFAVSAYILSLGYEDPKVTLLLLLINGTIGIWVGLRYKTMRTVITGGFIYFFTASAIFMLLAIPSFMSLEHGIWVVFLYSVVLIFYSIYEHPPALLKGSLKGVDVSLILGQVIVVNYVLRLTSLALRDRLLLAETAAHVYILVLMIVLCGMYLFHRWERGTYIVHATIIEFFLLGVWVLFAGLYSQTDRNLIFTLGVEIGYLVLLTMIFVTIMQDRFYMRLEKLKKHYSFVALGLQTIIFMFLNKWYLASAFFYELDFEYLLLLHTFLLFSFAFLSISIGKRFSWHPVKYFGAVLILLCIIKLFLIDLGAISILIRAVLFMIVGVVGLLYSRTLFREA